MRPHEATSNNLTYLPNQERSLFQGPCLSIHDWEIPNLKLQSVTADAQAEPGTWLHAVAHSLEGRLPSGW